MMATPQEAAALRDAVQQLQAKTAALQQEAVDSISRQQIDEAELAKGPQQNPTPLVDTRSFGKASTLSSARG